MKQFISLFLTFVFLMVSVALLAFAFFLTRTPDEPAPEIVEEQQQPEEDLESIFLGHPIFIATYSTRNDDWHDDYGFDLRHNQRYLDFDHVIFSVDRVTNEDIINWATTYLRSYAGEPWGIINLDNGNQLHIQSFNGGTSFVVNYREQENDTADQFRADWWTIASGQFDLNTRSIAWQLPSGNIVSSSPFLQQEY